VSGYVKSVTPAQYRRRSGVIEVLFDRLRLPNGRELNISGVLTSADTRERQRIDEEGGLHAKSDAGRHVVFIGAGAGAGTIIGVITGSALVGAGVGAAVGVAAAFLSKGSEAEVESGTRIGVELAEPLELAPGRKPAPRPPVRKEPEPKDPPMVNDPKDEPQLPKPNPRLGNQEEGRKPDVLTVPKPPEQKMSEQKTKEQQGQSQPQNQSPNQGSSQVKKDEPKPDTSTLVRVQNFQIQRGTDGSVGLIITAETNTSGWRLRTTHATDRDLLEIWLHGDKPKGMAAQVISYPAITITVPDAARVLRRLIIHGANGDFSGAVPEKYKAGGVTGRKGSDRPVT